jgi:EAL domain-containing protein (putative c-di-GMP-specific phosphodiesterase class I)
VQVDATLTAVLLRHCTGAVAVTDAQGRVTAWSPSVAAAARPGAPCPTIGDLLPIALRPVVEAAWPALAADAPVAPVVVDTAQGRLQLELEALRTPAGFAGVVASWGSAPDDVVHPREADAGGVVGQLRRGIEDGELRLHYQPIVELTAARPIASEALVRWQHPHRGLVGPAEFIDVAERSGLVVPLGDWVLREACRTAAAWGADEEDDERPVRVTVNLSARQLSDGSLVDSLRASLDETGCPAERLVFEVTETAVMSDLSTAVRTLTALKDLGVGLAIDDFGTGYSSLLYLKHFPVDSIKIDRSFVAGLGREADDSAIVAATISLAHSVDVRCVAEGVETVEHLDLLRAMGCDYAQGFLFSRPLELADLRDWFDAHLVPRGPSPRPAHSSPAIATVVTEMLASGASLHTIAAALNARGSRTDKGTRWSSRSIAHLVAHEQFPDVRLPAAR